MPYNRPEYLDKDSTFVEEIELDYNICNNCFRKIREHSDPHEIMPDAVDQIAEYQTDIEFDYFDDSLESGRPNIKKAYCKCGAVDWNDVRIRPLDREKMEKVGVRIVNHLTDKGHNIDEEKFFAIVDEKSVLPEYQFKEELVLEEAVEDSLMNDSGDDSTDAVIV